MSDKETKLETTPGKTEMEDDNVDLTTIEEIESSGDPKRDKVCMCSFFALKLPLGARVIVQGAASTKNGGRTRACCSRIDNRD